MAASARVWGMSGTGSSVVVGDTEDLAVVQPSATSAGVVPEDAPYILACNIRLLVG